jgi:DNA-directed RNA polymerase beta' subunit
MKKCSKCKEIKPESDFSFKNKVTNLLHKQCKECTRILIKNHYNENREYYLNKAHERNHKIKVETDNYLKEYLLNNPCIDCGESNIVVLEFDHTNKFKKFKAVSSLVRHRYPIEIVKREVAKCEVRCANCHRKKTANDFNWSKIKN